MQPLETYFMIVGLVKRLNKIVLSVPKDDGSADYPKEVYHAIIAEATGIIDELQKYIDNSDPNLALYPCDTIAQTVVADQKDNHDWEKARAIEAVIDRVRGRISVTTHRSHGKDVILASLLVAPKGSI